MVNAEPRTERRPLFGLATTILIGLALVVPFGIHYILDTEPYPAIIFPGGAQINTRIHGDRATFDTSTVIGFDSEGREVELSSTDLLDPVPSSHLSGLVASRFGQDATPTTQIGSGRLGFTIDVPRYVASEDERQEIREWLNQGLVRAGLEPDRLIVRKIQVEVDHDTGETLSRETISEVSILD